VILEFMVRFRQIGAPKPQVECDLDLSSSATAPILRGALFGGESEWAFFAFFKYGCRKRTIIGSERLLFSLLEQSAPR
jgi:hypothetical protein